MLLAHLDRLAGGRCFVIVAFVEAALRWSRHLHHVQIRMQCIRRSSGTLGVGAGRIGRPARTMVNSATRFV